MTTFLERDVHALGINLAANTLRRFWMMLAHWLAGVFNASELARSLDVSAPAVRRYLDVLDGTFMVRALQPWFANVGKRQVKASKVYFRDPGILLALLNLLDPAALRESITRRRPRGRGSRWNRSSSSAAHDVAE